MRKWHNPGERTRIQCRSVLIQQLLGTVLGYLTRNVDEVQVLVNVGIGYLVFQPKDSDGAKKAARGVDAS